MSSSSRRAPDPTHEHENDSPTSEHLGPHLTHLYHSGAVETEFSGEALVELCLVIYELRQRHGPRIPAEKIRAALSDEAEREVDENGGPTGADLGHYVSRTQEYWTDDNGDIVGARTTAYEVADVVEHAKREVPDHRIPQDAAAAARAIADGEEQKARRIPGGRQGPQGRRPPEREGERRAHRKPNPGSGHTQTEDKRSGEAQGETGTTDRRGERERRGSMRRSGAIGEGLLSPPHRLDGLADRLSEAQNPDLVASEADNRRVLFDRLDSESREEGGGGRPSKSYLVTEMIGNYKQRDFLNEAVEKAPAEIQTAYRHAIIHLRHSAEVYGLREWHRIHHETWIEELPGGWSLDEIAGGTSNLWAFDGSIIQVRDGGRYRPPGADGQRGLTREYRLDPRWVLRFQSISRDADPNYKLHCENKRHQGSAALDSRLRDPSGHRWGEEQNLPGDAYSLVGGALRVLKNTEHRIRIEPIRRARADYEEAAERARARHEEKQTEEAKKTKEKAEGRLHALSSALNIIKRQVDRIEGGVAYLQNAYEVQPISGRLSFRRGGPQGLPGAVKALAYNLPEVHNYDIKSSQTIGLRQLATELQELGRDVSTAPLDEYLAEHENGERGKDWACEEYDLPRTLVKRVEHAVKFGGVIPDSMAQAHHLKSETGHMPEIAEHVREYHFTRDARDEALEKLQAIFGPQVEMIKSLAKGLLEEYWDANKQRGGRGKGWVMRNHAGITFCPYDYEEGHVRRSKAMAWYLQGLEASYVHAITVLSQEYDYEVMANEHDGCITIGEVPEEAKRRAQELSGYHAAELVEKPFEDAEDIRELCERIDIDPPQQFEDEPCESSQSQSRKPGESGETLPAAPSTCPAGREALGGRRTPTPLSSSTRKPPRPAGNGGGTTSESTSRPGTPDGDRKSGRSRASGAPTTGSTSAPKIPRGIQQKLQHESENKEDEGETKADRKAAGVQRTTSSPYGP